MRGTSGFGVGGEETVAKLAEGIFCSGCMVNGSNDFYFSECIHIYRVLNLKSRKNESWGAMLMLSIYVYLL